MININSILWLESWTYYILLLPFSLLYNFITSIIRYSYRCGLRKINYFPIPIIVIGNLSVGGNGKTPLVLWLVEQLKNRGWMVGVVSRGYGGRTKNYPLLINSRTCSKECGDEPLLIWQRTMIPVAVSPKRSEAVAELLRMYSLDIIVSDDGLQHYALNRDIEWVVIDGERRFGNGWLLPAGPMRESIEKINNVQGIIVNGGKPKLGEIPMKLQPGMAVNLLSNEKKDLSTFKKVVAMAGIANPIRFFSTLRSNGIFIIKTIIFKDHKIYCENRLKSLVNDNQILFMTEKDAVKCRSFANINWWYLPVDAVIPEKYGTVLLNSVEQSIYHYRELKKIISNK